MGGPHGHLLVFDEHMGRELLRRKPRKRRCRDRRVGIDTTNYITVAAQNQISIKEVMEHGALTKPTTVSSAVSVATSVEVKGTTETLSPNHP